MNPLLALALVSGGFSLLSGFGAIAAGRERQRQARQAAYDQKLERENNKIRAMQEHNARMREFLEADRMSMTWLGYANRSMDASAKAAMKRSETGLLRDSNNINSYSLIYDYRSKAREKELIRSGNAALLAGYTSGISSMLNAGYDYDKTKYKV